MSPAPREGAPPEADLARVRTVPIGTRPNKVNAGLLAADPGVDRSFDAFLASLPFVLAGRDLQAGGTWLGVTRTGRVAVLTNFRDPTLIRPNGPSRGQLPVRFLEGDASASAFLEGLRPEAASYSPFNLLLYDGEDLLGYESRGVSLDWERVLSPLFIRTPTYGTRAATILHLGRSKGVVIERTFTPEGLDSERRFELVLIPRGEGNADERR